MIPIPEGYIEGVSAILQRNNRTLLQLREDRSDIKNPGLWHFIAGGVETGESPIAAAIRELYEELGVKLGHDKLKYFMSLDLPRITERHHIFLVTFPYADYELNLRECQKVQDFSDEEVYALRNIVPGVKEVHRLWRMYS